MAPAAPQKPGKVQPLAVGEKVWVEPVKDVGVIRFLGATQFQTGDWVGIEMEKPLGRNNGCVAGVQYFDCKEQHGIFVRPHTVSKHPPSRDRAEREKATNRRKSVGDAPTQGAEAGSGGAADAADAGPRTRRSETLTSIPEESRSNSSSRSNSLVWQDFRNKRSSGEASRGAASQPQTSRGRSSSEGPKALAEDIQKAIERSQRSEDLNKHRERPDEELPDGQCSPSLEAMAAEAERAVQTPDGRCALTGLVAELRARLRAAAHAEFGAEWERLFRGQDGERPSRLGWDEFRSLCRRALGPGVRDAHLRTLFVGLDVECADSVSVEELVAFVADPIGRLRTRLRRAARAEVGDNWASIFRTTEDAPAELDWTSFRRFCRRTLKLPDDDVQLAFVFRTLDADGSGIVLMEELAAFPSDPATAAKEQVKVTIVSARDLCSTPGVRSTALVDPYCTCEVVGKPHTRIRTKVLARTADPVWNHQESIADFTIGESLVFNIWHKNWMTKDVLVGRTKLASGRFAHKHLDEELLLLQTGRGIKAQLRVKVQRASLAANGARRQSAIEGWLSDSSDEGESEAKVDAAPTQQTPREAEPEEDDDDEDVAEVDAEAERARRSLQHIVAAKGAAAAAAAAAQVQTAQGGGAASRLGGDAARLARAEMEVVNLRRELERMRAEAAAQEERVSELEGAQGGLQGKLLAAMAEADALRREVADLRAAAVPVAAALAGSAQADAQAELQRLREELRSVQEASKAASEAAATTQLEATKLRAELAELRAIAVAAAVVTPLPASPAAEDTAMLDAELESLREELRSTQERERVATEAVTQLRLEVQRARARQDGTASQGPEDTDDGPSPGATSENSPAHSSTQESWRNFTPRVLNAHRCYARTWNGGMGGQCGKKKVPGSDFCEAHQDEESWSAFGRVDGPIPEKKLREFEREAKKRAEGGGAAAEKKPPKPRGEAGGAPKAGQKRAQPASRGGGEEGEPKAKRARPGGVAGVGAGGQAEAPGRPGSAPPPKPQVAKEKAGKDKSAKPRCTCGKLIHSEKCAAFRATHTVHTKLPTRPRPMPAAPPPRTQEASPSLLKSPWARQEVDRIAEGVFKLALPLQKAEWKRQLRPYHPDKREAREGRLAERSDAEMSEVYHELKRRYDSAAGQQEKWAAFVGRRRTAGAP